MTQRTTPARAGSGSGTAIIAAGAFVLLLGGLYFLAGSGTEEIPTAAQNETPISDDVDNTASSPRQAETPSTSLVLADPAVESVATPGVIVETKSQPSALSNSEQLASDVQACLEAGEFHLAKQIVAGVQDSRERDALLNLVVQAQIDAGEFDAALASIRELSSESQVAAVREMNSEETLAGGAALADFTQLIELIQSETSGEWEELDGVGGSISQYNTGVRVDPNGLLERISREDNSGRLAKLVDEARVADLDSDMAAPSDLRFVSLVRLEQAVAERVALGQPVTASMRHLGGLTSIKYVVADPKTGDILVGGPAEGWRYDENGQAVGVNSGRPMMQLDDLVTVMRVFSESGLNIFTCSIVPRQSGLLKLKEFVEASNRRGPLAAGQTKSWAESMEKALGMQDIVYEGVPVNSRIARVIIEADYKMKLIGIDKLDRADIPSFFDLLTPELQQNPPALDALRWWLTINYDSVLHSADKTAFEFGGSSVKCLSQNELINELGERVQTGKTDGVNKAFAAGFTAKYDELAKEDKVFADLQNIFDLALVAAVIQKHDLDGRTNWNGGVFAAAGAYQITPQPVPQEVHSVVNFRTYRGRNIVAQVAGGVRADLMGVLNDEETTKESSEVAAISSKAQASLADGDSWWFNAK